MDEDARFPNRKKRQDWDISALDKPAKADQQAPDGEQMEEIELPVNVYHVVGSAPKSAEEEQREREELYSFRESIPESHQARVEPPIPVFIAEAPISRDPALKQPVGQGWKERIGKFAESQTRVYAAIGVGLGILLGVIIIAIFTLFSGTPNGRYDLGPITSSAAGLKGHLFVEWGDKKLNYRLAIEPGDPERQAGFALAVASSPRPLSIEVHLQNSAGFVLCSKEILLKYDARNGVDLAAPKPDAQIAKTDAAILPGTQPAQGIDLAQADAQETAREKDKDIFKNQVGPDGQITSINAQGTIPCTAKAYENTTSWSFAPNFPTIAEQDEMLDRQQMTLADREHPSAPASSAHKKIAAKTAQKILPFSIEGDDAIVDFDASRGIIETSAGKVFYIDSSGGAISSARWQDYPVEIHYRCDRGSECVLMHAGAGALHARLRR